MDTISIAGLEVTALPFDPDRILDSLTIAAPRPQPSFPELEEMLARYRRPDLGLFREVSGPLRELRDSVERLADSLNGADRRLPAYASRYARFRRMYGRLAQRAGERDAQWRQISGDELQLARRAQQAADSLRAWEEEAFAAYAELTAQATIREGRAVHGDTTDAEGAVILRLEPGSWWIVARWLDPDNPFQEFYWSVPIRTTLPIHDLQGMQHLHLGSLAEVHAADAAFRDDDIDA